MAVLNDENTKPVGDDVLPPADYSGIDPETLDPDGPYANPSDSSLTFDGNVAPKTGDWVAAGGPLDDPNGGIDDTSPPGDPNQDVALYEGPQGLGPFVDDTPGDVPLAMLDPVSDKGKPPDKPVIPTFVWPGPRDAGSGPPKPNPDGGLPLLQLKEFVPKGEGDTVTEGESGGSSLPKLLNKAESNIDERKKTNFVAPDSESPSNTDVTDALDQTNSILGGHIQNSFEIGLDQDLIGTLFGASGDKFDSFSFMMSAYTSTPSDNPTNNQIVDLMQQYGLDNLDSKLNAMLGEQDFWAQGADQVPQQLTVLFSHVVPDPYKSDGIKESYDLIV